MSLVVMISNTQFESGDSASDLSFILLIARFYRLEAWHI